MNKYRFIAAMQPGAFAVFDAATETRVPGLVTKDIEAKLFRYERERPGAKKRSRHIIDRLTAPTVAELSAKIDEYFQAEQDKQREEAERVKEG